MRYTKKQYYSVTKNEIMKYITKCMNLEKIVLNEKTQTQKDKHCIFSLTCSS